MRKKGKEGVEEQAHRGADDVLGHPTSSARSSSTTECWTKNGSSYSYVNESRGQVVRGDDKIHTVEPSTAES